ncbi:TIGR03643 family protein [Eudoraea sp.]|uniref:TIGR03643 family protein n=1 Tax=Eudoraea sp. TaxID=1979955 RepID=UPI00261F3305|nr:TIGR03643 family protein [uncultured Eudoraea sp.]
MGKSSLEIILEKELTERQLDRIIEMAWEDRTPFEAIEFQFGLPEKEVIKLMRGNLKESSFKRWRKRVNSGVSTKHLKKRSEDITRFKCSRQRAISGNKISKR